MRSCSQNGVPMSVIYKYCKKCEIMFSKRSHNVPQLSLGDWFMRNSWEKRRRGLSFKKKLWMSTNWWRMRRRPIRNLGKINKPKICTFFPNLNMKKTLHPTILTYIFFNTRSILNKERSIRNRSQGLVLRI